MDNLTHSLVGLTAAKAGLEKLSPGATALCVLAANAPDSDIVVLAFGDRWDFLQHHRGITHSIAGVIALAILLPLIFYAVDRFWSRFRNRPPTTKFKGLLLVSIIVSATHPLLDWTNNYGIRLLLPWSPKWSYGDLVFIIDPYLWLILGGAAFLLTARTRFLKFMWAAIAAVLTFLVVASPRSDMLPNPRVFAFVWIVAVGVFIVLFVKDVRERLGERIAFAAFALVLCYWTVLAFAHAQALHRGGEEAMRLASANGEVVGRVAAMPRLANPFRWDYVFETDRATYRFDIGVMAGSGMSDAVRYAKPAGELKAALDSIAQQKSVRVFLGFARFPVLQLADPDCVTSTLVQLADLRYTEPGRSRGSFSLEVPVDCPNEQPGK
ncbi:MAG TPA: metal-dependent hydrolase [Pyrinomonadaceae bacterium]|jgi:inner membrane protein|nr:metal-dependent hydrolase [Pyrinomonadaceae bacterium]